MEDYEPGRVYNNIIKMMGCRNTILTEEVLSQESLVQKINVNEFVLITGTRSGDNLRQDAIIMTVLIKPDSNYASKTADFRRLTKVFPRSVDNKRVEVIIVSDEGVSSHVKKYIDQQFKTENPSIHIEDYDYEMFVTDKLASDCVPKHEIVTKEADEFCAQRYMNKDQLPKINHLEPPCVWLGVKPGMTVKVHRISETAGKNIAYRYCNR